MPPSCTVLGGFAIGAQVALLWQQRERCPHYCTDPDVTWGSGRVCPLVVQYWADLQLVHRLHCCGNNANAKC